MDENIIQIMIDIETLSTKPHAHILSIGAVTITPELNLRNQFYKVPSPIQERHIDPITVQWWMDQPKESFPHQTVANSSLSECLCSLNNWIRAECFDIEVKFKGDNCIIWAKGTDFDIKILTDAFESLGVEIPWKHNAVRDLRTLAKKFPEIPKIVDIPSHNALDDAIQQARWLVELLNHIEQLKGKQHGTQTPDIPT